MFELPKGHKGLKRPPSKQVNTEFEKFRKEIDSKYKKVGDISIKEYFVVMAMQGILSGATKELKFTDIAEQSVSIADALIEQLNNPQP